MNPAERERTATRASSTHDKLVASALDLFAHEWYETVSVAEICRHAGLSNGIFYRYFPDKQTLFIELLEQYLSIISTQLEKLGGETIDERLEQFVDIVIDHIRRDRSLVSVYREGQYRFPEYERRLRRIYTAAAERVFGREMSEAEYLYVVAGVRFCGIRHILNGSPIDKRLLKRIILHGAFPRPGEGRKGPALTEELFVSDDAVKRLPPDEDNSRNRLIESGIGLFGTKGFYNVNVYDIAREAGFSVGSFYLYFPTKEAFLSEIVRLIGRRTRRFITQNLSPERRRLEQELQGIDLFLGYFRQHLEYYSIVREAEFVVNDEARDYYDRFVAGYLDDLQEAEATTSRQKSVLANALLGISHYFGIEVFFADTISDPRMTILELGRLMAEGIKG